MSSTSIPLPPAAHPGGPWNDDPVPAIDEALELHQVLEPVQPRLGRRVHEVPQPDEPAVGPGIRLVPPRPPFGIRAVAGEGGLEVAPGDRLQAAAHDLHARLGHRREYPAGLWPGKERAKSPV